MIYGIGTDMIEISRIEKTVQRNPRFLERYYTQRECLLIQQREGKRAVAMAAVNFAGKEAVSKALRTGITQDVRMEEVEILREASGAPYVVLHGRTKEYAKQQGISKIHISLCDTKEMAIAYATAEKEDIAEKRRGDDRDNKPEK